jgi:hypothetical protein
MPLFFNRRFASHGSLPEVLKQGFEVEENYDPQFIIVCSLPDKNTAKILHDGRELFKGELERT